VAGLGLMSEAYTRSDICSVRYATYGCSALGIIFG
jgi:hypothetical protein